MSGQWPTQAEVEHACRNLWTGDQAQHVQTVTKALGEIKNMRAWEEKR